MNWLEIHPTLLEKAIQSASLVQTHGRWFCFNRLFQSFPAFGEIFVLMAIGLLLIFPVLRHTADVIYGQSRDGLTLDVFTPAQKNAVKTLLVIAQLALSIYVADLGFRTKCVAKFGRERYAMLNSKLTMEVTDILEKSLAEYQRSKCPQKTKGARDA